MNKDIIYQVINDERLNYYLKYHSYLYKDIMRGTISYKELDSMMKKEFKLTTSDKIKEMAEKLELIRSFLDILH